MNREEDPRKILRQLIDFARAAEKLVQPGNGEFQLTRVFDAYDWAEAQLPVKVGDRVRVSRVASSYLNPGSGWYPYRDTLNPEAANPAVVEAIGFYRAHDEPKGGGVWSANIRFDALPDCSFAFNVRNLRKIGEPPAGDNHVDWDALAGYLDACLDSLGLTHVSSREWLDEFRQDVG